MTAYFLFDPNESAGFEGSFAQCRSLGEKLVNSGKHKLLKIARCRPGEDAAMICFEMERGMVRQTPRERAVHRRKLIQLARHTPLEVL